jgi:hypothetical protein
MSVRIKYTNFFGKERGYNGWFRSRKEAVKRLNELGIPVEKIFYLATRKTADEPWNEYDPELLTKGGVL